MNTQTTNQFTAADQASAAAQAYRDACEAAAKVVENHAMGYSEPTWAIKLAAEIRALPLSNGGDDFELPANACDLSGQGSCEACQ